MTSFEMPTGFSFMNEKIYFCSHIHVYAESANIARRAQYRRIFLEKNFRRYLASPCIPTINT
jgi:hypothetical protein